MKVAFRPKHGPAIVILMVAGLSPLQADDRAYDPLSVPGERKPDIRDDVVKDADRHREIPVRMFLPDVKTAAPLVLFSHGLGGSRENNPYLGKHWSARGYLVVFIQHAGSDETVWKEVPAGQRLSSMKSAANLQNTLLRFKDVSVVIDQLERWNSSDDSPLKGRIDLKKIGMSGHSFGAVTTQGVSGQRTARGDSPFTDKRIKAALAMSPSSPRIGDPKHSFASVAIPWLLMTGTNDTSPIGETDVASRLAVYPALPAGGDKYELVLEAADHMAFSERDLPGGRSTRNPNHHRAILAISTAFWDAWLRQDEAARTWLDGTGPASILEKQDRWQRK